MITYIKQYFVTLGIFLVFDFVWLAFISKKLYKEKLGYIMTDKVNFPAAILFYLIFIAALTYFVIYPGVVEGNLLKTILTGAFLGFACYATYDLTNLAAIKDWPVSITIIDLCWGTGLSALTSAVSFFIINKFFKI